MARQRGQNDTRLKLSAGCWFVLLLAGLLGTACSALGQGLTPGGPIDFGAVPVGLNPPKAYTLTFSATVPTTIQSVDALAEGVSGKDYSVLAQTCTGLQTPPQSCTVEVGFSPRAVGLRRGALTVTDSSGAVVNRIFLHGVGLGPQMVVSPPTATVLSTASGLSPAQFSTAGAVVDSAGAVYFNDITYGRILKRDSTGAVSSVATLPSNANTALALDGGGTLYITSGAAVYSLAPRATTPTLVSTGSNALGAARGIAVDGLGYMYIADGQLNRILRLGPDGSSAVLAFSGLPSPLSQPSGVAIDGANNLYIADTGNNRIVVAGLYTLAASVLPVPVAAPVGVAVDASGSLAVTSANDRQVLMVPVSGAVFGLAAPGLALRNPVNLALAENGDLLVADPQVGLVTLARSAGQVQFPTPTRILQPDTVDGALPFQVLNTGNVALQFSVPGSGTNPGIDGAAFGLASTGTCPTMTPSSATGAATQLAVGQACSYGVKFTPQVGGTNQGTATLTAAAVGGGATLSNLITLTGTGVTNTTSFRVVASPSVTQPGSGVNLTVTAVDIQGNVDTSYRGTITFTATDATAAFPVGTTYTFTGSDAGAHTFSAPAAGVVFHALGTFTVSVTDTVASGTSNPVQVVLANGFVITATPKLIAPGGQVAFTVTAVFNGVAVPNYTGTVSFSASDPAAKFLGATSYTFTAADQGTHAFPAASGVQLNTQGTWTISASDGTYNGISNPVQVASADSFAIVASPPITNAGVPVGYTVTAMLNGAVATGFVGTVTFTTQDGAARFLSGNTYTFTAADKGTHTFTAAAGLQLNTPGTYTIGGTSGLLTGTSNPVTVEGVNGFSIVVSPSSVPLGSSAGFTVTATYNGTVVPGYTGTVTFSATDPAARFLGATSYTFTAADQGTHTFATANGVQFNTLGTWYVNASDGTHNGTSNPVTVAGADGFTITAAPATLSPGGNVGYTVSATYLGAVVPAYTGTVTFSASDPAARFLGATSYTFTAADQGTHTFAPAGGVQFNTLGTWTIHAGDGTLSGTSNAIHVVSATAFSVSATPSTTFAGAPVSFTVTALANGAVSPSFTGTVTFTSTDLSARFLSGTSYTFTSGDNGTHTFSAPAAGVQFNSGGTFTISATAGILTGVSNPVQVIAPTEFTIVASPSVTARGVPVGFTISATNHGVVIPTYTGTVTFSASDPAASVLAGTSYTFAAADAGTHAFPAASGVQFNSVGTWTVSATDGTISGTSNGVIVSALATVSLSSSANPTIAGAATTLTATAQGIGAVPGGTVVFLDGTTPLGSATLQNGTASLGVVFSSYGTHNLTAAYSGDSRFAAAISPVLAEVVEDFSIAVAPNTSASASVLAGHAAVYTLVVSPLGASTFAAPISLSFSGAPKGTMSLTPTVIAAGAGATTVTFSITPALLTSALEQPGSVRRRAGAEGLVAMGLMFLPLSGFVRRRKLLARLLVLAVALLPLSALTGCLSANQDGYYGSAPQTFNITVTGTSLTVAHAAPVVLTVQ